MFAFKYAKCNVNKLMRREAQAPGAYTDIFCEQGTPNKTVTDSAKV